MRRPFAVAGLAALALWITIAGAAPAAGQQPGAIPGTGPSGAAAPEAARALGSLRPRSLSPVLLPVQDRERLPVLDDQGRPIFPDQIEARMDRDGTAGLLTGGALGLLIGGALAAIGAELITCGMEASQELCSPQEEALRGTLGWTGFGVGLIAGMAAGWDTDVTTWQEAVAKIREERSARERQP